ncbi:hypothetical protein NECAME_12873 [Necator americanus]|uniref:PDZ domain-containing protein n=1 Tax=Necator americanus TaxID=51031 RepID=W2SYH9_NECAM|nr:hypothetical protein NECAME_12873 [Necator americanus]ETN74603.1 hypothetical protein NECAME_12873 [Necator americanus]
MCRLNEAKRTIGKVFLGWAFPKISASVLTVNGVSLEHLSHADSVRTLVRSGENVQLRLIRFPQDSAQAQCLKMLQEQKTLFNRSGLKINSN